MKSLILLLLEICIFTSLLGQDNKSSTISLETKGPVSEKSPGCKWGNVVKDELNDEWVWFGGTGGVSQEGALYTYILKEGSWKRAEYSKSEKYITVLGISGNARKLYAAVANRYYVSETESAKKIDLTKEFSELAESLKKITSDKKSIKLLLEESNKTLLDLIVKLKDSPTVDEIASARNLWVNLTRIAWSLSPEPSARCYASMAYDKEFKKIVLFGGETELGAINDTWVYDCATRKWSEIDHVLSPSPRLGHGTIANNGKVYLVGGFEPNGSMSYCGPLWNRLSMDVWMYSIKDSKWVYLKEGTEKVSATTMNPPVQLVLVNEAKTLEWVADILGYGKKTGEIKGTFEISGTDIGIEKVGVISGSLKVRGNGFDPAWYEKVPPKDETKFQEFLKNIPTNKWVNVAPPVLHVNRDWGTIVLDSHRDQLLHWAGGHSSHCGTDVAHFSLATGRWHILYTPELPFEACYSNDGASVPAMTLKPWSPHSYLSYGYDIKTQKMIWAGTHGSSRMTNPFGLWTYDPELYEWSNDQWTIKGGKFDVERHKTCMVTTPQGIAVWADKRGGTGGQTGLWLANVSDRIFEPIVGTDPKDMTSLPFCSFGDGHGAAYDSKRDRVYLMNFVHKEKNKIWAIDMKTKAVEVLEPKNSDKFPMNVSMARECTYVPDLDIVIVCTRPQKTLIYSCEKNEWLEMFEPGELNNKNEAIPGYGVSTGIEWDAKRKLLWLVQTNGAVYAMRLAPL